MGFFSDGLFSDGLFSDGPFSDGFFFFQVAFFRLAFTRCGSDLSIKAAGGVFHFPPLGRGPAFSRVVIFHLAAYARRIGVCLSPFYKLVAYHSAQEGAWCNGAFWPLVIIVVLGPGQA